MLKLLIISLTFATVAFSAPDDGCTDQQRQDFEAYKKEFNKTYASQAAEDQARKCFCKADNKIKEHNAKNDDYKQGHNLDSDRCKKVGSSYSTGFQPDEKKVKASGNELPLENKKVGAAPGGTKINSGINYRNNTGPVKNQGNCGCCWAMSTTSVLTYHNAMYGNKKVVEFSDQYLVDCVKEVKGCQGGNPLYAILKGSTDGNPTAQSYPFTGAQGTCQPIQSVYKNKKPAYACPMGNETMMQILLDNYGPGVVSE